MKIATHPYSPNGLRARDEDGNLRCWCGHLRERHANEGEEGNRPTPAPGRWQCTRVLGCIYNDTIGCLVYPHCPPDEADEGQSR